MSASVTSASVNTLVHSKSSCTDALQHALAGLSRFYVCTSCHLLERAIDAHAKGKGAPRTGMNVCLKVGFRSLACLYLRNCCISGVAVVAGSLPLSLEAVAESVCVCVRECECDQVLACTCMSACL